MQGISATNAANAPLQTVDSPITTGGASSGGGLLANQKDTKEAETAPKFGEIWQQIQSKYGAKADKPREIKKTLGKDDFLRIMVSQMKNQDPTSPFKPEQMAAEMAQFTSVEQLQNVNQNLLKMSTANQPMERLAMTSLIGKTVTVDKERFPHTEGQNESLGFVLPRDAKSVKISVVGENGETVLEKELGPQKGGENIFSWDGLKSNTLPAKTGGYMLKVDAKDAQEQTLQTGTTVQARVIGVSFEGAEPVFVVGDAKNQAKVTMRNIVRIDSGSELPAAAAAPGGAGASSGAVAAASPHFIAFKKGEGSANLDTAGQNPEIAAAIAKYQNESGQAAKAPPSAAPSVAAAAKPEGFANGLAQGADEKLPDTQARMSQVASARAPVAPPAQPQLSREERIAAAINGVTGQ